MLDFWIRGSDAFMFRIVVVLVKVGDSKVAPHRQVNKRAASALNKWIKATGILMTSKLDKVHASTAT